MKILVDMNLSPDWVETFGHYDLHAVHWSRIGDPRAADTVILSWARANGYLVFTNDLDFGTLLALTHAQGPSVIQVRAQDLLPSHLGQMVAETILRHQEMLTSGALIVLDERKAKVRILPLGR